MKFTIYSLSALMIAVMGSCSNNKNIIAPPASGSVDTTARKLISWVTTGDQSQLLKRQAAVPFGEIGVANVAVTIDTTKKFQPMDGFGYTFTGGSAHVISQLPAEAKSNLLKELFGNGENDISVNFLRLSIGASDLNDSVFTYDDMPPGETDPELNNFSLDKDRNELIPLLKEILTINPNIMFMATPWTPPVWMKDNGNSVGGSLKPEFYPSYAQYFVKYIQEMKKEGITIHAITPQNEPLHPGNNPSLLMHAEQQAQFIRDHLGPAFKAAALNTKIVVYDHNCDRPDYPLTILNDAAANAFVDGSAFHLYAGDISAMSQVKEAHPDKNIYFTEQYTAIESKFDGDLAWHLKNLVIGAPRNWSRTVLEWNVANDASFGPHTPGGCTTCKGALTIDGSAIKRNVAYYIIAHASKFVPAGSVRVGSNIAGSIHNVAFLRPDGKVVVIAFNDGGSNAEFSIKVGNQSGKVQLPSGAAGTFVIE